MPERPDHPRECGHLWTRVVFEDCQDGERGSLYIAREISDFFLILELVTKWAHRIYRAKVSVKGFEMVKPFIPNYTTNIID